jgi:hypothetical protein
VITGNGIHAAVGVKSFPASSAARPHKGKEVVWTVSTPGDTILRRSSGGPFDVFP